MFIGHVQWAFISDKTNKNLVKGSKMKKDLGVSKSQNIIFQE